MKISEAWELYEADKRIQGYSPHTLKSYSIQKNLLIRYLGDLSINEITYEDLKSYISNQMERLKLSSVANRVRSLKALFRWIHDEGHTSINPASRLKEPKLGMRVPKSINEELIEELRESCQGSLEHALIELFYSTGCRVGEVYRMNRNQIDWERKSIIVLGKGDKEREVYFSNKCSIWLKRYLKGRLDSDPALIVTERAPRRTEIAQIRYVIKRIANRAKIETNIYPHKLRHSYAMHLLDNGAPMELIQELLGHQKLDTTRIYAQLVGERRRELYKKYYRA